MSDSSNFVLPGSTAYIALTPNNKISVQTSDGTLPRNTSFLPTTSSLKSYNEKKRPNGIKVIDYQRCNYMPLPMEFEGCMETFGGVKQLIKMPPYSDVTSSSKTLPSRLDVLGNREFTFLAALNPYLVVNSVVGYDINLYSRFKRLFCKAEEKPLFQLCVLPWIFSRSFARIALFIRALCLFIFTVYVINYFNVATINLGNVWVIGTIITFLVLLNMSRQRWSPDGVMPFCRSLGAPEIEEYMFSYAVGRNEEENIRTLAKAVWEAGVGVWVDTIKLTPGDEVRSIIRTMVKNVNRVAIFLSHNYLRSPNCCIEFWEAVQTPKRLRICVMEELPQGVISYLEGTLKPNGAVIVYGFTEFIKFLNVELQDTFDKDSFLWWKKQKIGPPIIPENIAPSNKWDNIDSFKIFGNPVLPANSLCCGPVYISGDCTVSGISSKWPWHFILCLCAVACSGYDIYYKFMYEGNTYDTLDLLWLAAILFCNLSPFFSGSHLLETRIFLNAALRPLLASKSMDSGVLIDVVGEDSHPMVIALKTFLKNLGQLHVLSAEEKSGLDKYHVPIEASLITPRKMETNTSTATTGIRSNRVRSHSSTRGVPTLQVQVMSTLEHRDALFGDVGGANRFDPLRTIFIWAGKRKGPDGKEFEDPFTDDDVGRRVMRFLCLIAAWEGVNLGDSLFSALGIRTVDLLHSSGKYSDDTTIVEEMKIEDI